VAFWQTMSRAESATTVRALKWQERFLPTLFTSHPNERLSIVKNHVTLYAFPPKNQKHPTIGSARHENTVTTPWTERFGSCYFPIFDNIVFCHAILLQNRGAFFASAEAQARSIETCTLQIFQLVHVPNPLPNRPHPRHKS
jgi:hypothetical protein